MNRLPPLFAVALVAAAVLLVPAVLPAQKPLAESPAKWLPETAYAVPKETAPEGEGYFAIVEGHNGRLYIGTLPNAVGRQG
jgi:hypothetical protein